MISLERVREVLGTDAVGMSDQDLAALRQDLYDGVEQLVIAYEERRQGSRPHLTAVGTSVGKTTAALTRRRR